MKLTIKGTQEEIKKLLQTIVSSQEQSTETGLKKLEDELVFLTETENSIKRYTMSDLIKDSALTFVLGIAVGCMLFQLGIELLK